MTASCIFCDISNKIAPSYIVYEDDLVIAFLDRQQIRPGHTMVIPKQHIDHYADLPDELAAHIAVIGNKIARKMYENLKPLRVGFVVSGFGVAHAHYHVIPMHDVNDITSDQYAFIKDGAIAFGMEHMPIRSKEENNSILDLIRSI